MKPTKVFRELPTLKTKRLILRKMTMADAQAVYAYGRDPEVTKYLAFPTHRSIEDAKVFLRNTLKQYRKGEPASWAIVRAKDKLLMGGIGYMNYVEKDARIEVGYVLAKPYWSEWYMTEAFSAVIRLSFKKLGINRLQTYCHVENIGSYRVMEKCGLQFEGAMRKFGKLQGQFEDMKLYAILREDWQKAQGKKR